MAIFTYVREYIETRWSWYFSRRRYTTYISSKILRFFEIFVLVMGNLNCHVISVEDH